MSTTRETLKSTRFVVVGLRREPAPWRTDGVIGERMPPGMFVYFDPQLEPLESPHCSVGLTARVRNEGEWIQVLHELGRIEDDGRLCLFFGDGEHHAFSLGEELVLVESDSGPKGDMESLLARLDI